MAGQWIYRPEQRRWSLLVAGRQEITITADALAETCARTGLSRREALEWIATRPRDPWRKAA
jgi:Arc/MetJ family transcription regulator